MFNFTKQCYSPAGDVWCRLASLVNLLEKLDHQKHLLSATREEGNSNF